MFSHRSKSPSTISQATTLLQQSAELLWRAHGQKGEGVQAEDWQLFQESLAELTMASSVTIPQKRG